MLKKSFSTLFFLTLICSLFAQDPDHEGHFHDHHSNEIAIAATSVYILGEKEFAPGLHAHYVYNIPHSKFGFGVGYERIFDDHNHNLLGVIGSYRPVSQWSINLSPGVLYKEFRASDFEPALHLETAYEFEVRNFHIGPVAGIAISRDDYHIGVGIHIGIGF